MKTLLVISGGVEAADVARRAHEMGLHVVVSDRDPNAPAWDDWVAKGYITAPKEQEVKEKAEGAVTDVRESAPPDQHGVPVSLRDPYHQPHLQNFFNAVRGKGTLNCPAEIGYETAVAVLKVNEAIEAKTRLAFTPEEFKI